jgi:hypothetical protein
VSVTRPPDRRDSTPVGAGDQRSEFCINFARHHRFPPPWTVEDIGAAVVVTDSAGQKLACVYLACVYYEDEPGARSTRRR